MANKLSLKDGMRVWWDGMPESVRKEIAADGLELNLLGRPEAPVEAAHLFVRDRTDLERKLLALLPVLDRAGMIWVSWPKQRFEGRDRHHRGRYPRRRVAHASGRREGLFGR